MNLFLLASAVFFVTNASGDYSRRTVYSYSCTLNFLEGAGVYPGGVNCIDGMELSFLQAEYEFYLYENTANADDNNFQQQGKTRYYPGKLCGLEKIVRISCADYKKPLFGLSSFATPLFNIRVTLPVKPENGAKDFGYAAQPRFDGSCPAGLVMASAWVSNPKTNPGNENSNFFNYNGQLNPWFARTHEDAPKDFMIYRVPPSGTCDGGKCPGPSGERVLIDSTGFYHVAQNICVYGKDPR